MSVPLSKRGESKLQIVQAATNLEEKIIRMTMNEKYFPKRTRHVIGDKIINHAMEMTRWFCQANSVYPNSEENLKFRRTCQRNGKAYLASLEHVLNLAYKMYNIPDGVFKSIFDDIIFINDKFLNWQKSDINTYQKSLKRKEEKETNKPNTQESQPIVKKQKPVDVFAQPPR